MNITILEHRVGSREEVINQLSELEEITELFQTSGQYDFMAKVRVSKVSDYRDFLVERMASINNIKNIESHIVLEEIKYSTSLNI